MKIYVLKDKLSNSIVNVFLGENIDVALRSVKSMIESFVNANNSGALIQLKDCDLHEINFIENKIIEVKDLIKEPKGENK